MNSDERKNDRFGFMASDVCVAESQCVQCKNYIGKKCKIFGVKSEKYVRAVINEKCPCRKTD